YVPHSSEFTLLSSRTNELIILEPASVLGGLVRSTEGLPWGGATLQLTSEKNAKFTHEVGTLPNGRFLFNSNPDSHTITLEVSLKVYLPEKLTDIPAGRENLVIELEAGGSISGTVRNFSTQAPESGIAILLIPSVGESEFTERRTVSDSSGRYEFTELPAGQYDVRVQSEKLTATPHLGVTVASGKRTDKIDFSVYPGQEIRGLVLDEATGERIVAATVSLQSSVGPQFLEKGSAEARTDESGQFVFQNLPCGLYTLSATAEGYRQIPGPEGTAEVHLLENQSQEPVELLLRRGGSIEGQVLGHNNAPVPKASVQVINAPDAQYRLPDDVLRKLTVQTDSGGSFLIQGIPVDSRLDLILTATATGYAKGKSEPLILTEFLPTTVANVFLKSGTPLLVRVEGEHGFGLGDAEVRFVSAEFHGDPEPAGWSTKTGAMGEVTLMDLPAGVGRVQVSKKGYLSDSREVALPADDRIDFVLAKSNTIVGRVVDDAGVPFSEGWVQASAEQGSFGGGRATIQQNGFFTIEGIGSGTFTLEAEGVRATPIGKNAVRRILRRVRSGETQATITIPLRGRVQGQILESSTLNTIPNSTASLQGKYEVEPGVLRDFRATFSMGENPGEFDFTALPPGEYTLTASAPNFIPEKIEPFRIGSPGWRNLGKILLNSGAQVTGTVVDAQTGQPVSGAIVQLVEYKRTARTNSKGEYRIAALEAGITDVEFTHPDYKKTVLNLVQVRENKKTELGRTKLQPGATLLIRVLDSKRDPVANAKISVREMGVEKARNSSTDASGRSTVRGLEAGSVYISVSKSYRDGTLTKSQEKTVAANDVASVEIILEGGLQLEGQIVPPPNRNILSPFVKLIPIEPDGRPLVRGEIAVPVSNTNQFKVQNLTGGNYLLLTQLRVSNEVARWHQSIKLTDPRTSLTLQPPSGSLQGKVLSQTSLFELAPLEKAHIRLRALSFPQSGYGSLQSWWEWQTLADGTGAFRIPYLRGGEYELVVTPQGSENPWVDIITLQTGQQKDIDVLIPASQLKAPGTFAPFWFEE
ncbi:MAG: carboxypeptidase regulatory-like domain-containing protein, partial [Candidatus Sumerlaeia bacterium]|nr:carboxypeptidase regulatory-like domain-containing protein [Candidatus Sumerlaeia bacterium]